MNSTFCFVMAVVVILNTGCNEEREKSAHNEQKPIIKKDSAPSNNPTIKKEKTISFEDKLSMITKKLLDTGYNITYNSNMNKDRSTLKLMKDWFKIDLLNEVDSIRHINWGKMANHGKSTKYSFTMEIYYYNKEKNSLKSKAVIDSMYALPSTDENILFLFHTAPSCYFSFKQVIFDIKFLSGREKELALMKHCIDIILND